MREIYTREEESQMGSIPPELSLDVRPTFVPKRISEFLGELAAMGSVSEKKLRIDDFVKRLEEEMKKIDAFKRELPLCMLLLNDGLFVFVFFFPLIVIWVL